MKEGSYRKIICTAGVFVQFFSFIVSCKSRQFNSQKTLSVSTASKADLNLFEFEKSLEAEPVLRCAIAMRRADMFESRALESFSPDGTRGSLAGSNMLFFAPSEASEFYIFSAKENLEFNILLIRENKGKSVTEFGNIHWTITVPLPKYDGKHTSQSLRIAANSALEGNRDLQFSSNQPTPYTFAEKLNYNKKFKSLNSKGGRALLDAMRNTGAKFTEMIEEETPESLEKLSRYQKAFKSCESILTKNSSAKINAFLIQSKATINSKVCTDQGGNCDFIFNQLESALSFRLAAMKRTYENDVEEGAYYFDSEDRSRHKVFADKCVLKYADGEKLNEEFNFVMSKDGDIFATLEREHRDGEQNKGEIYHSSFLSGSDVAAAGLIAVENGRLTYCNNDSGHYVPDNDLNSQLLARLKELGCSETQIPKECVGFRKE